MDLDALQTKLLQAARRDVLSDRVPLAFERRVMARLTERSRRDPFAEWTAAFWRAALSGLAVALVAGAVNLATPAPIGDDPEESELYAALENASLANADEPATDLW
jgi:hypothetical protein